MKNLVLSILCISAFFKVNAQCSLIEVPLTERANNATLIVEGKVISQNSFWNTTHTMIYTSNEVEVYKIFKGTVTGSTVSVITVGGTVAYDRITTDAMLNLKMNDVGVFTLAPVTHMQHLPANSTLVPQYETYASAQGFVRYDLNTTTACDIFHTYADIETELYPAVTAPDRRSYVTVLPFNIHSAAHSGPAPTIQASITNFSPTTITAGTASLLTINGSGFGATQGSGTVGFKNADDGGATYITPLASQYVSWSNTQIQVRVPQNAGTGTIQVTQGTTTTSASTLTISWANLNVEFDPGTGTEAYQTDHINDNGSGGYTWQMNANVDGNATERAAFMRAFDNWRCTTGINWTIGTNTTVNDAISDGINVICNDNAAPLSAGILGVCYSYWSGCASGPTIVWYVNELDIIFDEGSNISPLTWQYGPALPTSSQYDFESVCVHELGHGHQLGHVIASGQIMHYALSNGATNRTLSANDIAGANNVQSNSIVANVCGPGAMTAYTCASSPVADFSGTPTALCAGGTVAFTDLSTNTPTSWSWTFTGGTPSTSSSQNPTITYSTPGTYDVSLTATNASGSDVQTFTGYITVYQNPNLTPSSQTNVACNGGSTGSATVAISGGTPSYTYNWTPGNPTGDGTVTVSNLASGTWTCTVTDSHSCTDTQTFSITEPTALVVTPFSQTNVSCNAGNNGSATVLASGGAGGYTYSWSPSGGSAATATGLNANSYLCTVTDANGCTAIQSFNITEPAVLSATRTATFVACFGGSNGSASVNVSGGTSPYSYSWSPTGGTGSTETGLTVGVYTCTITDANGCQLTKTFNITQPSPLQFSPSQTDNSCFGSNDASASSGVFGGTPAYSYAWSPSGGTGATASNLAAGSYTCAVTDANGCTATQTYTITQPAQISISMSETDENCSSNDGTATATPSNGVAPYTYLWAPGGQTTQTAVSLPGGTYTCTVTDANGCSNSNTVVVNTIGCSLPPVANFSGSPTTICEGGSVSFTDLSTNSPTSWSWTFTGGSPSGSNAQNPTVTYSAPGTYAVSLTATNASGSDVHSVSAYITVNANPAASGTVTNVSCFGGNSGAIDLTPSGNGPFTFVWNPSGQTTEDRTAIASGNYSVTVTDANGCAVQTTFTVTQPTALNVSMSAINSTCPNNDGSATATVSGGTSPYTYVWSPGGQTTATATALSAATYTCIVTDANGCSASGTVTVNQGGCGPAHLATGYCGITLTSLTQQIYCNSVPNAVNYQYKFMQGTTTIATYTRGNYLTNCLLTNIPQIQYAQTYTVYVRAMIGSTWTLFGSPCTITTPAFPAGSVVSSMCGTTLASFTSLMYCNAIAGTTNYEWKFMQGSTVVATYQRGNYLTNCQPSNVQGISYAQTYDVYVRGYVGGVWGPFGAACSITMPPFPTTEVSPAWCNGSVASLATGLTCVAVTGATNYQWKVQLGSFVSIANSGSGSNGWRLLWNTGTVTNTTYDVSVRAMVGGIWGSFGPVCSVHVGTSSSQVPLAPGEELIPEEVRIANPDMNDSLSINVYPNPFAENITVVTNPSVQAVLIYNSFGEFVRSVDLENGTAEINLSDLAHGIYLIKATSANGVITKTVIKQ